MAIITIQNSYLCHVTKLMTSSGLFQLTSNRKKYFHASDQCFRYFLDKALQKPENMLKNYLKLTENRSEKLIMVRFLLSFLFSQMVEK